VSPLRERGVALMLVLWLIVVLGAIAVGVGALAREESNVVGNVRTRAAARYAAESGGVLATRGGCSARCARPRPHRAGCSFSAGSPSRRPPVARKCWARRGSRLWWLT